MSSPFEQTATSGVKTEQPAAGSHPAVLVGIIDLGTHDEEFDEEKDGKKTGKKRLVEVRKILLGWELPNEQVPGKAPGTTHVVTKDFNLNFGPKAALRKMFEGWRGRAFAEGEKFDPAKALGQKCLVNVKHKTSAKGTEYAVLDSVMPLPKGMQCPGPGRTPLTWTFADGGAKLAAVDWFPDYLYGEKMEDFMGRSKEMKAAIAAATTNGHPAPASQQPAPAAPAPQPAAPAPAQQPAGSEAVPF